MEYTQREVMQYVKENDVKFIKLFFADIFGTMKSVSVQPSVLDRAFAQGIPFDASRVHGFMHAAQSDLFIVPDPSTLNVLPWRPQQGRVARMYCKVRYPDGSAFEGDTRAMLEQVVQKARGMGYDIQVGTECEFYLFRLNERGEPTMEPHDHAEYCSLAPLDKGENVRRDIILTLEQMGIEPETSHHETGPGQNEIDFKSSSALRAADNFATFKNTVRTVAARDGLFASFLPKPLADFPGSGLHINLSLHKDGTNLFATQGATDALAPEAAAFVAGILRRIREMTLFLNPLPCSYQRLGTFDSPRYVSWSSQNHGQLVRVPAAAGDLARVELRSPDPLCNQYAGLALVIAAGLEGIQQGLSLMPPRDVNLFSADKEQLADLERLPATLQEALELARSSSFIRSVIPRKMADAYFLSKEHCVDPEFGAL